VSNWNITTGKPNIAVEFSTGIYTINLLGRSVYVITSISSFDRLHLHLNHFRTTGSSRGFLGPELENIYQQGIATGPSI
jgi:hypothetical protein